MERGCKNLLAVLVCFLLSSGAVLLYADEQNKISEITPSTVTVTEPAGGQKAIPSPALIEGGQINTGAKERMAMPPESIPAKQFKPSGKIIEYNPEDLNDKTIFSIGDIVKVNIGSKKNVKEGTAVAIFKKGKLLTELNSLERLNYSIRRGEENEKKQQLMVNKIGEGKITAVKKKYSLLQILVVVEPVTVGDFILLKE